MKRLLPLCAAALVTALTGCAVMRDTMTNASGVVKICSSSGGGVVGVVAAGVGQQGCIDTLTKEGYVNLTELGWTGVRFRNVNDKVIFARPDANSPAEKAGLTAGFELLSVNDQTPVDAADANRMCFGPLGKTYMLSFKTPEGTRTYPLTGSPLSDPHQFFATRGNIFFAKDDALNYSRDAMQADLRRVQKRPAPLYPSGKVIVGSIASLEPHIPPNLTPASKTFVLMQMFLDMRNTAETIRARGIFGTTDITNSNHLNDSPSAEDGPVIYAYSPTPGVTQWRMVFPDGRVVSILPDQPIFDLDKGMAEIERLLERQQALAPK